MSLATASVSAAPAHTPTVPTRLDLLPAGSRARINSVAGDTGLRRRLLEMGLTRGIEVNVVRRAPLGDPIELKVRGYLLSLRAEQAAHVACTRE